MQAIQKERLRTRELPANLPPRGLSRTEAAAYVGVGTTLFDRMVSEGLMPAPKRYASRVFWDRIALDAAFAALPDDTPMSPMEWDL